MERKNSIPASITQTGCRIISGFWWEIGILSFVVFWLKAKKKLLWIEQLL